MTGKLFIVATPIGNLNDITYRAIETLKDVNIVLAEDTRHSKKLFAHFEISTPLKAFHEHNERGKTQAIITELKSGISIALISDAGTPLISDPGYFLVSNAKKEGIEVIPIPGPSAIITALSASGLATNNFSFFGFLPSKKIARIKYLQNKTTLNETIIFYESPKRILATLTDMLEVFGSDRMVCLAKELTKSFETIRTDKIEHLIEYLTADLAHQKGEFVILISPTDKIDFADAENQIGKILPILSAEMGAPKAAKLANKITGIDKKPCYNKALDL
jgi:16S rRNA (cytidine1402-2'-O)-methyltransferase